MRPKTFCSICGRIAHAHGLCDTHHRILKKSGAVFAPTSVEDRFWAKVQKSDECWIWTANRNRRGYGKFCLNKRQEPAHRVVYMLTYGDIPPGAWVLHHCDNPSCVRPDHLYLGTHQDNMRDRQERNRVARGDSNGSRTRPDRILHGEQCSWAKLTIEQIVAIRQEYTTTRITLHQLAAKYGVSKSEIHNVVKRKVWNYEGEL